MDSPENLLSTTLTPQEAYKLTQFDATQYPALVDVYYEFLFSMYLGLTRKETATLNRDENFSETEQGLFLLFSVNKGEESLPMLAPITVNLEEVVEGATATIYHLYKERYGDPFFGPITDRVYEVKVRELLKTAGIERKLSLDLDFARRSGLAYYQSLGMSMEEIREVMGLVDDFAEVAESVT